MVWDILIAAATFDIATLLDIAFKNILWVFIFFVVAHMFFEGKHQIRGFIHVFLTGLLFAQLLPFLGWQDYTGTFLLLYYLIDFTVLKFAETSKFLTSKLVLIESSTFYVALVLFNIFVQV